MRTTTRTIGRTSAVLAAAALASASVVVAAPAASAADGSTATTTTTCATGALPDVIKGRPAGFQAGLPDGFWIWRDSNGWHLRVTHDEKTRKVFSGSITATDRLRSIRFRTEPGDTLVRSADGRSAAFRFTNYGGVDGIDFAAGCSQDVIFRLAIGGAKADPVLIRLGSEQQNPASNPFTITRTPAA